MFKIIKFILIFIWFSLQILAENNENLKKNKINFWTNTLNEILKRFRYNKLTHELEMLQDFQEDTNNITINISTKSLPFGNNFIQPLVTNGNVKRLENLTTVSEGKFQDTNLKDKQQNFTVIVKQIHPEDISVKLLTTDNKTITKDVKESLKQTVSSITDQQMVKNVNQENSEFPNSDDDDDDNDDSITAVKDDFIDFELKNGLQSINVPKIKLSPLQIPTSRAHLQVTNQFGKDACSKNCSKTAHIACGHSWTFSPKCSENAKLINLRKFQHLIVHHHNTLRNNLAGNLTRFEPAVRMGTTQWHNELAAYARLNAMTCDDNHDFCHSTKEFKMSGQNLAVLFWRGRKKDLAEILTKMISDWHSENVNTEQSDLDKFRRSKGLNNGVIAHFTTIVNERNTHIGCAAVAEKKGRFNVIYFTCNYARNNILGVPIYEKGPTASKCSTGVNPKYINLCSLDEKYEYNK